jgi:hypothetical protein
MECRDPFARSEGRPAAVGTERRHLLEQIDDAAVVQLYADGFEKLSLATRRSSGTSIRPALAGRDIYYDQRHRHNLGIRRLLEQILRHPSGVPEPTLKELTRYTKLVWLNTGPYNNLTARKFLLNLDRKRVIEAMELRQANGARFDLADGETIEKRVETYARVFFDPDFEPMVTCKTPGDRSGHPRLEREQHVRRRDDGRPRGLRGKESAQFAAGETRRSARRGGLQGGRPLRHADPEDRRPPA